MRNEAAGFKGEGLESSKDRDVPQVRVLEAPKFHSIKFDSTETEKITQENSGVRARTLTKEREL